MKAILHLVILASFLTISSCRESGPRSVEDFNFGWCFTLGDSREYSLPEFSDSLWRPLHLPHDWSIEGQFNEANPSTYSCGALPGGIGWYRKHFTLDKLAGHRYFIEFDGIFMNSEVYLNGTLLGTRPYGYSSFSYDITNTVKEGDNVIAVKCDNSLQPNSRWYAGCGIYRDVRLVRTGDSFVEYDGVCVRTEENTVHASAIVAGNAEKVLFRVMSPSGLSCGTSTGIKSEENTWKADIQINKPELWDIDSPNLYTLTIEVFSEDGQLTDRYDQSFGFRTAVWDPDKGFILNGRPIKLQGVCLHHDLGCIGSAFYPRAMEKRLVNLKEMGCNSIRTSHNPPAPAFLDMCDRMGLLVVDEVLDMWRVPKTRYDYSIFFDQWHETDICDMVRRDRNHPSVVLWSAGNELPEQHESDSSAADIQLALHVVDLFKDTDPTRPVSIGLDFTDPGNVLINSGAFDVLGFNYRSNLYDQLKEWFPNTPMLGSETASALESRGWYVQPSTAERVTNTGEEDDLHQCSAYDNTRPWWADLHSYSWKRIKERNFMAGGFVWTGYDYLGEPTPYRWPSRSSYFGIFDLAGFQKDIYYMYESEWTDHDVLHLFPHWNWEQGDSVDVWCYYSNADAVELFVNGKSVGLSSKEGERLHAQWLRVPFEAGEIRAVSYKDGKKYMECCRETTGAPEKLCLKADRKKIKADGYDLCYVTVTALDAQGREVPTASDMIHFNVSGEGELFGVDNGNAADTLCLKGQDKALFAGKAIAVIRTKNGREGKAVLTATSDFDVEKITICCR